MKKRKGFTPLETTQSLSRNKNETMLSRDIIKASLRHRRLPQGNLPLTGFTLVELLISASLFAVMMVGLVSFFRSGIRSYSTIDASLTLAQEAAKISDRLSLDLKNSFSFSSEFSRFNGTADTINFFTLIDVYENALLSRKLAQVSYEVKDRKLMRFLRRDKASLDTTAVPLVEELASGVEACIFSYGIFAADGKTFIWKDSWEDFKSMPLAVRVNVTIKEKDKMEFNRTVYFLSSGS